MKQLKSKRYKALMSDIDGTLILNIPHSSPTQKVIDAVKKADKLIYVGVATSRPFHHAEKIINVLNLSAPCIVGGGSQIVNPKNKKVVWEKRIPGEDVLKILNLFEENNIKTKLLDDEDIQITKENIREDYLQAWIAGYDSKKVNNLIDVLSSIKTVAINKVPFHEKDKTAVVITNIHATKQHGILEVAKMLDLSTKDFIGIGDGGNDFPLLMACGLKVAMGNAVKDLKEIADYIAPPVEEDGVADVIERFVLNEKN